MNRLVDALLDPRLAARALVRRSGRPYLDKLAWDAVDRPHYGYGVAQAALQARALGLPSITALELGVAGGNGLVTLEQAATAVEHEVGVHVAVVGFDAGSGMPQPVDHRDLPYVWQPGFYAMDEGALRARLRRARVVLGDVAETVPAFVAEPDLAPIGFVAFDLDYWSSTRAALALFDAPPATRLPRVLCYLDDVIGEDWEIHCRFVGELAAVEEFNAAHPQQKIAPIHGLAHKRRIPAMWNDQMFVHHDFAHPSYGTYVAPSVWDHRLR